MPKIVSHLLQLLVSHCEEKLHVNLILVEHLCVLLKTQSSQKLAQTRLSAKHCH